MVENTLNCGRGRVVGCYLNNRVIKYKVGNLAVLNLRNYLEVKMSGRSGWNIQSGECSVDFLLYLCFNI